MLGPHPIVETPKIHWIARGIRQPAYAAVTAEMSSCNDAEFMGTLDGQPIENFGAASAKVMVVNGKPWPKQVKLQL